jgi:DNA polymerase-3 subunit delta'
MSPWQTRQLDSALAAWRAGRLGHAQLLCGPEALGKREVAHDLAARLLCEADASLSTCGSCRSCQLRLAGTHPDFRVITLEENEKTGKLRSEIVIEQVRVLSEVMQMTSQRGGAQVVIIDPADLLNNAAANALLKTLEEPANNRFLLLVSAAPQRLSATIRSRCQRTEFALPEREEALTWLLAKGHESKQAAHALEAAQGHPGLADRWLTEGQLVLRDEVLRDLAALGRGTAAPLDVAQAWVADSASTALRLRFAADAALGVARSVAGAALPSGLTPPRDVDKLGLWFEQMNRLRAQLAAPLKHELALAGLLGEWRSMQATTETRR